MCQCLLLYKLAEQSTSGLGRFLEYWKCNLLVITQAPVVDLISTHSPLGAACPWALCLYIRQSTLSCIIHIHTQHASMAMHQNHNTNIVFVAVSSLILLFKNISASILFGFRQPLKGRGTWAFYISFFSNNEVILKPKIEFLQCIKVFSKICYQTLLDACYNGSSVYRIAYRSIKSSTCNGAKLGFYSENKFMK